MKRQRAAVRAQQGISTLLMTSLTLSVAMVFVLTSYSTSFYQIKRAQNTVFSRQAFWLAEGGLACGFGLIAGHFEHQPISTEPAVFPGNRAAVCQSTQQDRHVTVRVESLPEGRYQVSAEARVAGRARVRLLQVAVVSLCGSAAVARLSENAQECVTLGRLPQVQERLGYQVRWLRGSWQDA